MNQEYKKELWIICGIFIIAMLVLAAIPTIIDEWFPNYQQKCNKKQFEENPSENSQCKSCKRYFPNKKMWTTLGICDFCKKKDEVWVVYEGEPNK